MYNVLPHLKWNILDLVFRKTDLKILTNEMLPLSIHWVACGTCYRKSEGTELCAIELQHSSLKNNK